ncbi:AraC family transcriptional regulator [Anaerotaenia torta]|uniref:AraC family transcriptional regulator n=1 Tax=Anaerotaenia torta TaxID=433293 RepID=UPI003D1EF40E
MNSWTEGIQNAIWYMEEHITEPMDIEEIAGCAYVSAFHFQRIFSVLCGFTVGEYIRNRRLSLAAQELSCSNRKVIDAALKYGYDSPDSFAKAFLRFHGISPSAAKEKGASLRAFAPVRIKLTLEGGNMMEYKIVEKAAFTVMGVLRNFSAETAYREIPAFWQEHTAKEDKKVCGMYGVCIDSDGQPFDYLIADNYVPWNEIPEGYVTRTIPAGSWAVFPCRGALPEALQKVNTAIWNEWLPNCKDYKLGGNYNIEMYAPPCENPADTYSEIWVPVERI